MKFSSSFLDEIRARVPISQVVGRAVQWDRKKTNPGKGDWWACCPFHHEKTPSFHADDRKGYYYCFGCHAKGDVFTFMTDKLGLSFPEAVEQLAAEAGLEVPRPDPREQEREKQRATLAEVMEMAARFYEERLAAPEGQQARRYIAERGLSEDVVRRFRLGFAPDARDALLRHLDKQGVSRQSMLDAGLIAVPDDGRSAYDRFRHRLMFPIRDARGRVIAFGGRALGEARAKYLNSPETDLFHKSRVLYNLDQARRPAHDKGAVIAAEGYMDVIAMAQAGFDHAVAPLGTALTGEQLTMLWRLAPEPVLCFDGDAAGQKAAWRALETALPHIRAGHSLRFALLPEGTDPDDLIRSSGAQAFAAVIDAALPLVEVMWKHVLEHYPARTPEERANLEKVFAGLTSTIGDAKVRNHYRDEIRARLRALWQPAASPAGGGHRGHSRATWKGRRASDNSRHMLSLNSTLKAPEVHEREILRIVLNQPEILDEVAEELANLQLSSAELDKLRRKIIDFAAGHAGLDSARLHAHLLEQGLGESVRRLTGSGTPGRQTPTPDMDFSHLVARFRAHMGKLLQTADLNRELEAALKAFEEEPSEENLARINVIREELDSSSG